MGLRCSLLGHDFGDVVVERDRDDRGEEIVITERELRECRRCDAESIVTENKEVRRKRPADEAADSSPAGGAASPDDASPDADATSEDATSLVEEAEESAAEREQADEDAIILDDTDSASETAETQATKEFPDETSAPGEPSDETLTPGESPAETEEDTTGGSGQTEPAPEEDDPDASDDGMITAEEQDVPGTDEPAGAIEDRDGDVQQWHGEASPSEVQTDTADTASDPKWPNDPDTADRFDQPEGDSGARSVREQTGESEFEFGDEDETEPGSGDPSSGIASAGPIDTTAPPDGGLEGVLRCPACDYAIPIARSPNRPGDICPECHAGYLAEDR